MKIHVIVIFLFALVGMVTLGNVVHELSHKADLHDYVTDEEICFLEFDKENDFIAHYSFRPNEENSEAIELILKYTEKKAIIGNILIALLFVLSYFYYIDDYFGVKK